jgi:hypothetical protein
MSIWFLINSDHARRQALSSSTIVWSGPRKVSGLKRKKPATRAGWRLGFHHPANDSTRTERFKSAPEMKLRSRYPQKIIRKGDSTFVRVVPAGDRTGGVAHGHVHFAALAADPERFSLLFRDAERGHFVRKG